MATTGRHVRYAAALALAIAGELARAQAIANDLDKRFPEDTSVRFSYLPTLRAVAALRSNDPSRAIELLRPAATYEFAQPGISFHGAGGVAFGAMYPTYLRGLAYLALRKPADAAAEFQKILDHTGVVLEDPMGALARLQMARALALSGDTGAARKIYDDLMSLWKNADPDLRVLEEYGRNTPGCRNQPSHLHETLRVSRSSGDGRVEERPSVTVSRTGG